jgi:glycosyltransferase involved in cell wall biosynthesis
MGIFGNFNRALTLARGEWITILNDDDLLAPDYLRKMFAEIDGRGDIDGIISRQDLLDERPGSSAVSIAPRMTRSYVSQLLKRGPAGWLEFGRRAWGRVLYTIHRLAFERPFRGRASRRIRPATFFWGPALGNGAGFLFRVDVAIALGGFYAEEFPASDLFFFARFADRYRLHQHRDVAATYRIAENESAKLSTAYGAMLWIHKMQLVLLQSGRVPRWWRPFAPMMIARMRTGYREVWRLDIPKEQIQSLLKIKVPEDRPRLLFLIRSLLAGL